MLDRMVGQDPMIPRFPVNLRGRMAKSDRESKKPKKDKVKIIAAAPSQKGATAGWQPSFGSGKKK